VGLLAPVSIRLSSKIGAVHDDLKLLVHSLACRMHPFSKTLYLCKEFLKMAPFCLVVLLMIVPYIGYEFARICEISRSMKQSNPRHTTSLIADPYASLRYPEFRFLIVASFLLTMALLIQEVAIGYELYRITRDPLSLGLIGLIEAIPFISFTLYGGHVADRKSKRNVLLWSAGGIAFSSIALQFFTRQQDQLQQSVLLVAIYGVIFVIGLCRAFLSPTAMSLRGILVPPALFENAATWGSSSWQVGAIVGPAVAGFLYAWIGFANTLLVVTLCIVLAFFLYAQIKDRPVVHAHQVDNVLASIKEGVRFVFRTKIILYSISLDLFSVLFGGVMAILPIYAQDILNVGAEGLGILRAAPSIGATLMLILLSRFSPMNHAWRNLLIAVSGFGVCILIFSLSTWMLISVAALFLSGAFDSISVVIRATILQVMTPDSMRARVMAVNGIFLASSNEVGAFESGSAAKILGTIPSVLFGGIMTLLIVCWVYFRTGDLLSVKVTGHSPSK
jgi:MFS family permease